MSDLLTITYSDAPLEIVAAKSGGDGRTVTMLAARYGVDADAGMSNGTVQRQRLDRNVFAKSVAQRGGGIPFTFGHWHDNDPYRDPSRIMARGAEWIDGEDGLRARVRIVNSPLGDHLLAQIHDGIIRGVSVGFTAMASRSTRIRREGQPTTWLRHEARLNHVAFVDDPAMPGAGIEAVAAHTGNPIARPTLAMLRAQIAVVESKYARQ